MRAHTFLSLSVSQISAACSIVCWAWTEMGWVSRLALFPSKIMAGNRDRALLNEMPPSVRARNTAGLSALGPGTGPNRNVCSKALAIQSGLLEDGCICAAMAASKVTRKSITKVSVGLRGAGRDRSVSASLASAAAAAATVAAMVVIGGNSKPPCPVSALAAGTL